MIHFKKADLALFGGHPVRKKPMPFRRQFDEDALEMVKQVFEFSWKNKKDFGYQGHFEEMYTQAFCKFQGSGFADAVSSGTAALYISLQALELPKGSDIIISPITDPGAVSPVVLNNFAPIIADCTLNSPNMGAHEFKKAITPGTSCAIITHLGGFPAQIDEIMLVAKKHGIKIIEDCSQAHGAMVCGQRVGTFGDIGVFSTMFSKNHSTGGCGGIVFTKNSNLFQIIRACSDRGKAFFDPAYDPKDPSTSLFPALNFNLDELSCAIGISSLSKLDQTIKARKKISQQIYDNIDRYSNLLSSFKYEEKNFPSPFFLPVWVDTQQIDVSKKEFARAISAEGIDLNPHYTYVVSEWKWLKPYLKEKNNTPNAIRFRDHTFNLLFNEKYSNQEIKDIINAITKVETALKI